MKALILAVTLLIAAVDAAQFMTAETPKANAKPVVEVPEKPAVLTVDQPVDSRWCSLWFSNCFEH